MAWVLVQVSSLITALVVFKLVVSIVFFNVLCAGTVPDGQLQTNVNSADGMIFNMPMAAFYGTIVGVLVAVGAVAVALFFFWRAKRRKILESSKSASSGTQ